MSVPKEVTVHINFSSKMSMKATFIAMRNINEILGLSG